MSRSALIILSVTIIMTSCYVMQSRADDHHTALHNRLSRKVLERACAASKDTLDEIMECFKGNKDIAATLKVEVAQSCHKASFGKEFNPAEIVKHKEEICNHKEKFEEMTACVYRETAKTATDKEMDKLSEALVDLGLCIINALDG